MSLSIPYFIYGHLKNNKGIPVDEKEIRISDEDDYQGYVSVITDENGYFQINIQDISSDGDLLDFKIDGISRSQFNLDIGELFKHIDIVIPIYHSTDNVNVNVDIV